MVKKAWNMIQYLKENQDIWKQLNDSFVEKFEIKFGTRNKDFIAKRFEAFDKMYTQLARNKKLGV